MSYLGLLSQTCTIRRNTSDTVSASGEQTRGYTDLATGVPCEIQPVKGKTERYDFGDVIEASFRGFFLPGQDIRPGDKVVVGSTEYDVLFVDPVRGHHIEADLAVGLATR